MNSTHLLRDDEDGRNLLELIQQRAEQWAASNLVTVGEFAQHASPSQSDDLQSSTAMITGCTND